MKLRSHFAILIMCVFFCAVFAVTFWRNKFFPVLVMAGEDSVATWMSGALLTFTAALCFVLSMRKRAWPWVFLAGFFMFLALDERFMFHERIKDWIIFSMHTQSRVVYELPVVAGALVGAIAAFLMWRQFDQRARIALSIVVILGTASVVIDILAAGVVWEEASKLVAELLLSSILVTEIDHGTKETQTR